VTSNNPKYPGIKQVINGNGAIAYVMSHVCGGVIGYPITPSTEISETFEAARADGQLNVWGKHAFFTEAEGEHSAQSGALGAALTGGHYISNASSSQGILYALESHYVTAGKRVGGFVLQVAARVVSRHSLNVMAGHDDIYSLLPAGYTILFGSNPGEAADLAAISYKVSANSLIPVANAMDGFATSHVMSGAALPEPELLKEYLDDPAGRMPCPTAAQEVLFGAKGRVFQLGAWIDRQQLNFLADDLAALRALLEAKADQVESDQNGSLLAETLPFVPADLREAWRRQWQAAWAKGTRQVVPALVDPNNPGLTGPVQNQPDFQAGIADHRTHFAAAVPDMVIEAMDQYAALTGRAYQPVMTYDTEDADYVIVGMGSITDDVRAVMPYLRQQGLKVGVVSVKLLQPFPEAQLITALKGAKAVTILERSDDTALTRLVSQALLKGRWRAEAGNDIAQTDVPALPAIPRMTTAIFGLGGHDVQPRHIVAAFKAMASGHTSPLIYLGSQFFDEQTTGVGAEVQAKMRQAYPETVHMALRTEANPPILPPEALRIRFHSVGGYGTIATGKLLTDVLSGVLDMHSKSAPKYGSEKSGAATNYYITLSPEPVLLTNNELEEVEVVVSPDHQAFVHTDPLRGLVKGGTFIMQSSQDTSVVWTSLPEHARRTIVEQQIHFYVVDAFRVARTHAPSPNLETRMMGIAFIGAVLGHVDKIIDQAGSTEATLGKVRTEIAKKFGSKGQALVDSNMSVIEDAIHATRRVDYGQLSLPATAAARRAARTLALSAAKAPAAALSHPQGLFDPEYYEDLIARPFRDGTIAESPVLPGHGLFMPPATGGGKDKGLFRREIPLFKAEGCTGCLECALACPDSAIPNTIHELHDVLANAIACLEAPPAHLEELLALVPNWATEARRLLLESSDAGSLAAVAGAASAVLGESPTLALYLADIEQNLAVFPVARTRPFFDAAEKERAGSGALLSVVVDPSKCTGCMQCVDVCGPGVISKEEQSTRLEAQLEKRFEIMSILPNSPERFWVDAIEAGDLKRLLLDHAAYYSLTGGHGACRGCGEVTALHLVTALSHTLGRDRRQRHIKDLTALIEQLRDKAAGLDPELAERRQRIEGLINHLDHRLYFYEAGPSGAGPAPAVFTNATGCSSVYASTMPAGPYNDPWVNSLFQDAQPLAAGIHEGLASQLVDEVKALRLAEAELADGYDPALEAQLQSLDWRSFTPDEASLLPVLFSVCGDGAAYDIGFGAMSRVMAGGTPIKVLVLDTGGYSNTGGQASTASFISQDADLARIGKAHPGKREARKELGLLAMFHPNTFVAASTAAMHTHFLTACTDLLNFNDGCATLLAYTPCSTESGFAEELSSERGRLAVDSRMSPVFVHNPARGANLTERLSLEGNPGLDVLWTNTTIQFQDADGRTQLKEIPFTAADFAFGEVRFAKNFKPLASNQEANAVPVAEFIELDLALRAGKVPFIWATNRKRQLIKVAVSAAMVELVEDRKHFWLMLRFLAGRDQAQLAAENRQALADLQARYDQAVASCDASLDSIAAAMADLATSSKAPTSAVTIGLAGALGGHGAPAPAVEEPLCPGPASSSAGERPVWLDPADLPKCNDCATCYQELPQLFEKATILVDGKPQVVGRLIEGALDSVVVTPELTKRIARVKANCDAEIIV